MEEKRCLRNEEDPRTERIEEGGGWKIRGIGEGKGRRRYRMQEGKGSKNREDRGKERIEEERG